MKVTQTIYSVIESLVYFWVEFFPPTGGGIDFRVFEMSELKGVFKVDCFI